MPIADTFENDIMKLAFNATAIANFADNAATAPLTSLYIGLHTADPTDAGSQTSSEATYTGYARVAVLRTSGGFTVAANAVTNAAIVTFAACTAGSSTVTYFTVGTASSGAGKILWYGTTNSLAVTAGVTPSFAIGALACDIT